MNFESHLQRNGLCTDVRIEEIDFDNFGDFSEFLEDPC